MSGPEPANMMPKPTSQKHGVPMQKSIMFFIRMLPVFFARVRPASHKAKPACIKYTRNAATSTQMTVDELYIFKPLLSRSNHGASSIFLAALSQMLK